MLQSTVALHDQMTHIRRAYPHTPSTFSGNFKQNGCEGYIHSSLKYIKCICSAEPWDSKLNDVFICSWIVLLEEEELINGFVWIVENTIVPVPSLVFRSQNQNLNVITDIKQRKQENLIWAVLFIFFGWC